MNTNLRNNAIVQNQFIGTWQLVSSETRDADGQVTYPLGPDAVGYLMYTSDLYMSATLMKANRPKFAAGDVGGGSTEEMAMAAQTYLAYCGKYEIRDNKVIHHIEASLFPNWVGVDQERFFEITDDRLELRTPPLLLYGKQQVSYLIWKRISIA